MATTKLLPNQKLTYTVKIEDAAGNPAFVADPAWAVSGMIGVLSANPPVPTVEPPEPPVVTPPVPPDPNAPRPDHTLPGDLPPQATTKPSPPKLPIVLPPEGGKFKRKGAKVSSADGYSITIHSSDKSGVGDVTFTCDADLSPTSTKPIVASAQVVVAPGEAVVVELVPGTPEPV